MRLGNFKDVAGVYLITILSLALMTPLIATGILVPGQLDIVYDLYLLLSPELKTSVFHTFASRCLELTFIICVGIEIGRIMAWGCMTIFLGVVGTLKILHEIERVGCLYRVGLFRLALAEYRCLLVSHKFIGSVASQAFVVACFCFQLIMPIVVTVLLIGSNKLSLMTYLAACSIIGFVVPFMSLLLTMASKPIHASTKILDSWKGNGLRNMGKYHQKLYLREIRSFTTVGFPIGSFGHVTKRFKVYYWYDVSINTCNLIVFFKST